MKKFSVIFTLLLCFIVFGIHANATDVFIDGIKVNFNDSTGYPFIENGRTLVPLRAPMEAFGASVIWDGEQRTAIVTKDTTTVTCKIDEMCIYRNNSRIDNDSAAIIRDGRTYLPIRIVLEAFGATVSWDGNVHVSSGSAGQLIYEIENSGLTVSNLWKSWETALAKKSSGDYSGAIEAIRQLTPKFLATNDGNSNAMLYKHLGECYSAIGMTTEAAVCFLREADFWAQMGKEQERIDATRRGTLTRSSLQLYAGTTQPEKYMKSYYGQKFEPVSGIYLGAYAESDSAVHNPWTGVPFYSDAFPQLVQKDMASYLLYITKRQPLSTYASHIAHLKEQNKILQVALEPIALSAIVPDDSYYIQLAKDMESSGLRYFVRFAGEMNDVTCPWYTTDYNLYIEKFRIIANIFHTYAPNSVAIVWSPNFYPPSTIPLYYPGDQYVDYIGVSSYKHYQPETDPLQQHVDRTRWSSELDTICSLYAHKKPIIISEAGATYYDYVTKGDITQFAVNQLIDFSTYLPIKYPAVKAAYYFDCDDTNFHFSLSKNPLILEAFRNAIKSPAYLSQPDTQSGFGYYELGNNVPVAPQLTELCSYVKTIKNDISYVVYRINGVDVATAYSIPYSANVDFSPYSGQQVFVSVLAFNTAGAKIAEDSFNIKVQ